jgi:hypothetical protein
MITELVIITGFNDFPRATPPTLPEPVDVTVPDGGLQGAGEVRED